MSTLLRTPLLRSTTLGDAFGGTALLKAELFQKTGSFKPRGILAKLATLTPEERACGVITVSAGNAAAAVAFGCALEKIDCLVVMWQGTSEVKAAAARAYGAAVDREAPGPGEAFARLEELRAETGRVFVHPFDDPVVIEGHSSLSREILEDAPETDVIVAGVGGGGLISGVAVGAPGARVVGVEPEGSTALRDGLAAGHPVLVRPDSIADALNAPDRRRALPRRLPRARGRVGAGLRGRHSCGLPVPLRAREARSGARGGRRGGGASGRQGAGCRRQDRRRCRLGWQRGRQNRCCYPEFK